MGWRCCAGLIARLAQTADLPTPPPANTIGLSSAHVLLATDTAFDMSLITADAMPDVIASPLGATNSVNITLPITTTGNSYVLHFTKPDQTIYQNFAVPTGGYWTLNFA